MSQASAAAGPMYAAHNDAMSGGVGGSSGSSASAAAAASSSISSSTTSGSGGGGLGGLTASSLVTAAIGKQTLGLNYEAYSSSTQQQPVAKSRSSVSNYFWILNLIFFLAQAWQ